MHLADIRAQFPILHQQLHGQPLIYFDNAATSQKPLHVIEALTRFYQQDNANVHRGLHELSMRSTDAFEAARARAARFIGAASAEEIIFTRGTTEGVNLIANSWSAAHLKPGDIILSTGMEHHSNLVPWQLAAQRHGASLRHIPVLEDGTLDLDALDTLLDGPVKMLAFVHVSNSLGTINPARELCARARALGITTFVDGAQAAGHMPVDVREIGCDFYAFSGHKMCAPTGIGILYGRGEALASLPPWQGGGEMILSVSLDRSTYKAPPARFEAGTPDIAGAIGLAAAMDYLDGIGLERIQAHGEALTRRTWQGMSELPGIRLLGPREPRAPLIAFALECAHPHDLVEYANTRGLALRGGHHCTQPLMKRYKLPGTSRASFYLYNNEEEVDAMLGILHDAVRFFRG